jgi:hypothetical protein
MSVAEMIFRTRVRMLTVLTMLTMIYRFETLRQNGSKEFNYLSIELRNRSTAAGVRIPFRRADSCGSWLESLVCASDPGKDGKGLIGETGPDQHGPWVEKDGVRETNPALA